MLEKTLLAAAQLLSFPVGNLHIVPLLGDAVPQVLDKLEPLGPTQPKKRCKFGVHHGKIIGLR